MKPNVSSGSIKAGSLYTISTAIFCTSALNCYSSYYSYSYFTAAAFQLYSNILSVVYIIILDTSGSVIATATEESKFDFW
jgi:hypothetical protein